MRWRPKTFFLALNVCLLLGVLWVLSADAASPTILDAASFSQLEGQTVRVGIDPFFPPFASLNDEGSIVGFQVTLVEAIAEDGDFQVEWVAMPTEELFAALESGEIDAVVATMIVSNEEAGSADRSNFYYMTIQSIYISPDVAEEIDGLNDLAGQEIGVESGTAAETYATSTLEEVEVTLYPDLESLVAALGDGEVSAIIADTLGVERMISEDEVDIINLGLTAIEDGYSIVIRSEVEGLLAAVNTSLDNIIANHTYNGLYREWFEMPPPPQFHPPAAAAEGVVNATFTGDLETLAEMTCDSYEQSEDFPTADDMQGVEELGFNGMGLVYDATVDGDSAQVMISGTFQFLGSERNAAELFDGPFEMRLVDETWVFCPSDS